MLANARPRLRTLVQGAFGDVARHLLRDRRLALHFLVAALALWGFALLELVLGVRMVGATVENGKLGVRIQTGELVGLAGILWSTAATAIRSALQTPVAIAVHRKLLLDESPSWQFFAPLAHPRGQQFFMVVFLISWVEAVTGFIPRALGFLPAQHIFAALLPLGAIVAVMVFGVRVAPAFPAIAIDRPGPWLSQGLAVSRGSAWRIFWILLVIVIVIAIPTTGVGQFGLNELGLPPGTSSDAILARMLSSPTYLATFLIVKAGGVMIVATWAAALSRFYRAVAGDPATPLVF
jgi:hypothetical protein